MEFIKQWRISQYNFKMCEKTKQNCTHISNSQGEHLRQIKNSLPGTLISSESPEEIKTQAQTIQGLTLQVPRIIIAKLSRACVALQRNASVPLPGQRGNYTSLEQHYFLWYLMDVWSCPLKS